MLGPSTRKVLAHERTKHTKGQSTRTIYRKENNSSECYFQAKSSKSNYHFKMSPNFITVPFVVWSSVVWSSCHTAYSRHLVSSVKSRLVSRWSRNMKHRVPGVPTFWKTWWLASVRSSPDGTIWGTRLTSWFSRTI